MKKAVFFLLTVLLIASCKTDNDNDFFWGVPPPRPGLQKEGFNEMWDKWNEQGIENYSFDAVGFEYKPYWPASFPPQNIPLNVMVYAHVTVVNGAVVNIENLEPGQRPLALSVDSYTFDKEVTGTYSWGTISDIYQKIFAISEEEKSSPYAYWYTTLYNPEINIPDNTGISIYNHDHWSPPDYSWDGSVLLYHFFLRIANFQVTE